MMLISIVLEKYQLVYELWMIDKTVIPRLFGMALKRNREAKNVKRSELARLIRQQHSRVAKLEEGGSDLRLSSILGLTLALDITPGELLDEVDAELRKIIAAENQTASIGPADSKGGSR